MKDLIVLMGASHSGKSTYAKEWNITHEIISSDQIRKELGVEYGEAEDKVWQIFAARKFELMLKNQNIILDACHLTPQARYNALRDVNGEYRKIAIIFDVPFWKLVGRCLKEKRMDLSAVRSSWNKFEANKPTEAELRLAGFDEVREVK